MRIIGVAGALTEQHYQLPIVAKLANLGIPYSIRGTECIIYDWDAISESVKTLVREAMRVSNFEDAATPGVRGPFLPITVTRKFGILIALRIEEQFSFRLPAGKILEVWYMGGKGEGADTKIRFQNLTDGTTIKATALSAAPGILEGDGINPLERASYGVDKSIAFEAVNENLLTSLSLGGFGVFTVV